MPKLSRTKARQLIQIVVKLGFKLRAQSGSHAVYVHPDGRKTSIPIHPSEDIGIGLLTKIVKKDLGIRKEDFTKMLKKN